MTHAYIFIGQSGSGKGTQAALLESTLKEESPTQSLLHFETGTIFRSFIESPSYTAKKTREAMEAGVLPASFIGIHVWSHQLIETYTGQDSVIIDGTPRVAAEVPVLLSASKFYGWHTTVVFIDVSDTWANERLLGRGRVDDTVDHEREARLAWFHSTVMPAVELLKASSDVTFISINGERPIKEIHAEICERVGV